MTIQLKKKGIGLIKIFLAFIVMNYTMSCTNNIIYNQYKPIEFSQWHKDSIINFTINSTDTIAKNNLYVTLRNNKDYEFSNLFLIV